MFLPLLTATEPVYHFAYHCLSLLIFTAGIRVFPGNNSLVIDALDRNHRRYLRVLRMRIGILGRRINLFSASSARAFQKSRSTDSVLTALFKSSKSVFRFSNCFSALWKKMDSSLTRITDLLAGNIGSATWFLSFGPKLFYLCV